MHRTVWSMLQFPPSLGWPEWLPAGLGTRHVDKTLLYDYCASQEMINPIVNIATRRPTANDFTHEPRAVTL
jgi:hypothetical protein